MGLLKSLKNMRDIVQAAPGVVEQAQRLQSAYRKQGPNPAVTSARTPPPSVPAGDLEPIAGVSLGAYAQICKQAAAAHVDEDGVISIAREHRVDAASWRQASEGWAERFKGNVPLAAHYGDLYQAA